MSIEGKQKTLSSSTTNAEKACVLSWWETHNFRYILKCDVTTHLTKRTRAVLAEIMITCTSIFADHLRTDSEIQLTRYRVALGKWIPQSNMKRLFAMMAIFICENRAGQINSSYTKVRPLQWANKKWQDENLRFNLKCKLQGLSWLKTGLMILQPQHAQAYITLCSNHW